MRRSFTIGVLFVDSTASGLTHEFFSAILNAAKVEAEKRGYDITFIASDNFGGKKVSYLEHARSRNIDGILIASVDFHDPAVIELANSGLPVVTIDYVYNGCTAIMAPALAVQFIFSFVGTWNNYLIPALLIDKDEFKTLPLIIAAVKASDPSSFDLGKVYCLVGISIIPLVLVYLGFSRFIIKGMTAGAVKG